MPEEAHLVCKHALGFKILELPGNSDHVYAVLESTLEDVGSYLVGSVFVLVLCEPAGVGFGEKS